jgi:hypothetical protein
MQGPSSSLLHLLLCRRRCGRGLYLREDFPSRRQADGPTLPSPPALPVLWRSFPARPSPEVAPARLPEAWVPERAQGVSAGLKLTHLTAGIDPPAPKAKRRDAPPAWRRPRDLDLRSGFVYTPRISFRAPELSHDRLPTFCFAGLARVESLLPRPPGMEQAWLPTPRQGPRRPSEALSRCDREASETTNLASGGRGFPGVDQGACPPARSPVSGRHSPMDRGGTPPRDPRGCRRSRAMPVPVGAEDDGRYQGRGNEI